MEKRFALCTFSKKRIVAFAVLLVACLCLASYIFELSTMTSGESAKKSNAIVDDATRIVASQNGVETQELSEKTQGAINYVVRKSGHLVLFALLGVLTYFLVASLVLKGKNYWMCTYFSVPACVLYGISDEVHQLFVEGRHGKVTDVIVDAVGAVVGTMVAVAGVVLYIKAKEKGREKN